MEKSIKELLAEFDNINRVFYTEDAKREARIKKHQKCIDNLQKRRGLFRKKNGSHSWVNSLLNPIGEALVKHFNAEYYEILGPFGLGCDTSIYVWITRQKEETREDREAIDWNQCISVTFRPGVVYSDLLTGMTSTLYLRDFSTRTGEFGDNTLGGINGFNNPSIDIENWSMDQIIGYVEKTNADKLKASNEKTADIL